MIYSVGGPGSSKSVMCKKLAERYSGYMHVSIGDMLRTCVEEKKNDNHWKMIAQIVLEGDLVPPVRYRTSARTLFITQ